jgi:hypothetical protein
MIPGEEKERVLAAMRAGDWLSHQHFEPRVNKLKLHIDWLKKQGYEFALRFIDGEPHYKLIGEPKPRVSTFEGPAPAILPGQESLFDE